MYKKNDILCKSALEDFFKDFLLFAFKDIDKIFDLEKPFEFLNKELAEISKGYQQAENPQFVDLLAKVYFKDSDKFSLFHVEVQGYRQNTFSARMHDYFIRLRNKYKADVCSYVIFTDPHNNFRPDCYEYKYMTTSNIFKFETYKVKDQNDESLRKETNPFALIIRIILLALKSDQLTQEHALEHKIRLCKEILSRQLDDNQKDSLVYFLTHYIHFDNVKMNINFDNAINQFNTKINTMGVVEMVKLMAMEEAALKERHSIAEKMIRSGETYATIQKYTELNKRTLKNMKKQLAVLMP